MSTHCHFLSISKRPPSTTTIAAEPARAHSTKRGRVAEHSGDTGAAPEVWSKERRREHEDCCRKPGHKSSQRRSSPAEAAQILPLSLHQLPLHHWSQYSSRRRRNFHRRLSPWYAVRGGEISTAFLAALTPPGYSAPAGAAQILPLSLHQLAVDTLPGGGVISTAALTAVFQPDAYVLRTPV